MSVKRGCVVAFGAAAIAIFAAPPADAQVPASADWHYSEGLETCRAYRSYGDGENSTLFQLRTFGPGSAVQVTIAGGQVPKEPSSVRLVELGWGGKGFENRQFGLLGTMNGVPSVSMLTSDGGVTAFVFAVSENAVAVSRLNPLAESLQLRVVGNLPADVPIGPLAEPLAQLRACEQRLMDQWGWGRDYFTRVATGPRMRDPQSWFYRAIIYPAVQNLNRVSSILQLRLKIDAEGRVAECVVQSSPGSSLFGSKNCTGIRRMGRFDPGLDSQGQPVVSYMQMSITFARFD